MAAVINSSRSDASTTTSTNTHALLRSTHTCRTPLKARVAAHFNTIVVNGVRRLVDDNTTISKRGILAVCCRLPCLTHVLRCHWNDCHCDGL